MARLATRRTPKVRSRDRVLFALLASTFVSTSLPSQAPLLTEFVIGGSATGVVTLPLPIPNDNRLIGFKMSMRTLSVDHSRSADWFG
jgi:Na+-transporting methylmalonyl-CoA/oxaloacetate decarboxylase beta subunit